MDCQPTEQWHKIAGEDAFKCSEAADRIHTCVEGRYVSVIRHNDKLHCLDSVCFHARGPLALGDIEEIKDSNISCIICPWHYYCISLETGEKWYQAAERGEEGKLHAGDWKTIGRRQRIHQVERRPDGIYVKLNTDGQMASDEYARKQECGHRVKSGASRVLVEQDTARKADGSLLQSHSSPLRPDGLARISPRGSPLLEGEDVWPSDLTPTISSRHGSRNASPRPTMKE